MKHEFSLVLALLIMISIAVHAQVSSNNQWINGFAKRIYGENLNYHSCHPEATLALLIRCLNEKDYIEWETDKISSDQKSGAVTFVWIGGYSTGTSTAEHTFKLFLNGDYLFSFTTVPKSSQKDWSVKSNGAELSFKFARIDQHNDFFGYFSLTFPIEKLKGNKTAKLKVTGDASGSRDWYMTMQYPLTPKIRITPEKIVSKTADEKLLQRVKVSIDHFDIPVDVKINSAGSESISSKLQLGMNDFYLNYDAPKTSTEKTIAISIDGKESVHSIKMNPARNITFYLIPHGHVDIGYTDLQTEVEKKHWQNYEKAINYAKRSENYPDGSKFKWNVEVLWAVKSYLEKFPEKKNEFFDAVKKGWIGLDGMYANVQTGLCRPEELYRLVDYSNQLEKEIGVKIESAMISDIPGYTWGMVNTFADNGIKYFSVGPNESDRIGNTLKEWGDKPFYWKSQSGDKKILIWLAGKGYSWFHGWRLTRDDISPIVKYLDQLDENNYPYDMVHVRYNIGGDNGYPDSTLADYVKRWNESHETPKFKIATTMELFRDFENKYGNQIPTYSGDFTPYWEDGAGSTAGETAVNRNIAELLTQLEIAYSLKDYHHFPTQRFDEAWKNVLLFSEHTWGAWNSISEPEAQSVLDQWEIKKSYAMNAYNMALELYTDFVKNNFKELKQVDSFYVFNPSSWTRTDLVSLPGNINPTGDFLFDENGKQAAIQRLTTGEFVFVVKDIPPFGKKKFRFAKSGEGKLNKEFTDYPGPVSKYLQLKLNLKKGTIEAITRITDLTNYVNTKNIYQLNGFVHTGKNGENPAADTLSKIRIKEYGPVLKTALVEASAPGCDRLEKEIRIYADLDKIDLKNILDKKKDYNKESIRFVFPFEIKNPETRIDIAWSVIQPEKDQLIGANKNYFTIQRWVDVSNKDRGVTLASLDAPFIEVGGMNAEAWMADPNKQWAAKASSSSLIYSWVMNNSWHTNFKASQEGRTEFRYSLQLHDKFEYLTAYKFGVEQNQPLIPMFDDSASVNSKIKIAPSSSAVVTSLRASRDGKGLIIRVFNPSNKNAESKFMFSGNYKLFLSNGDEEELNLIDSTIKLNPFEVRTIKVEF